MVKSMTGYGRHQQTVDSMNIIVEIKSVNHRYFDFSSRTPRIYGFLDEKLNQSNLTVKSFQFSTLKKYLI